MDVTQATFSATWLIHHSDQWIEYTALKSPIQTVTNIEYID